MTSGRLDIEIQRVDDMAPGLLPDLDLWFRTQFAHTEFTWADRPWRLVARAGDGIVGHIGLLTRTICVDQHEVFVAGVGGVMTREGWRHRGVASTMLAAASGFMREDLGAEFGLLLCRREVEPVYAKSRWITVAGPTFFDQPSGRVRYPRLTMILGLSRHGAWPGGEIDLCGLPW